MRSAAGRWRPGRLPPSPSTLLPLCCLCTGSDVGAGPVWQRGQEVIPRECGVACGGLCFGHVGSEVASVGLWLEPPTAWGGNGVDGGAWAGVRPPGCLHERGPGPSSLPRDLVGWAPR